MSDKTHAEKLPHPELLETLTPDQTVAAILRLAMEVAVLRDRLRTHEALLAEHGLLGTEAVDAFTPSADESQTRNAANAELIQRLLRDLGAEK
ncbi:MAG: hypothetical protein AAFZ58_01405 [Pseudomonadota bacterium]